MTIQVIENEFIRTITDDMNPRVYQRQFKCHECKEWIDEDDSVWINPITGEATMEGEPFHTYCAPPELENN
jgi:hypothetical protein